MRRQLVVAVMAGAVLAGACASITGADDLFIADDDGGGASASSGSPAGGDGPPAANGEGGTGEGGIDPPLPQCSEGVCVPTADGWSPATTPSFFGTGSCPDGWPTKILYKAANPFTCDCACTPNGGGSCEGLLTLTPGNGFTCTGAPKDLPPLPGDGGCVVANLGIGIGSASKVTSAAASPPSSCTGIPRPVGGGAEDVPVCSGGAATASPQCKPTESCVPAAGRGNAMCIVHDGLVACPSGFGARTEITAGAVDDERTCSPTCACEPGCNEGKLEAFFTTTCDGMVGSLSPLGECQISNIGQGKSFRYYASNGCGVAQRPDVQGDVTLEAPKTLCCARRADDGS